VRLVDQEQQVLVEAGIGHRRLPLRPTVRAYGWPPGRTTRQATLLAAFDEAPCKLSIKATTISRHNPTLQMTAGRTYSNNKVKRAGVVLASPDEHNDGQQMRAAFVMAYWRGLHAYPINTFQALLRKKLGAIDEDAIVAQRLKRFASIVLKLQRFPTMQLARMQDIGGLRAVVGRVSQLRPLEDAYRNASFKHVLTHSKDYLNEP